MFKLSAWVWIVVGLFIGITTLSYGYFQFYKPDTDEAKLIEAYGQLLQVEASKVPATEKRIENAKKRVQETAEQWRQVILAKSSGDGLIDLTQDPLALTVSAPSFRDKVQRAVNAQVKVGGITVVQGPFIPLTGNDPRSLLSSYFNYGAVPYPVLLYEPGAITVRGTYDQIARNVVAWSEMKDFFALVTGLAISGTSPELTATYNLVLLGFVPGGVSGPFAQPMVTGPDGAAASVGDALRGAERGRFGGATGGGTGTSATEVQ